MLEPHLLKDTRRQFLKRAALLSGAVGLTALPCDSIRRARAIDPDEGTTLLDAEHVVILMQENRSFDHAFGTLKGVRGFDDPRAITLSNGNPVWVQSNAHGQSYVPFRLNIKDSNSTWLGCLPHGRTDQVDARNNGQYDRWLEVKHLGDAYEKMPFALGYYTRQDIPFYYALADAFTICDQHFCSALSCTTPNRLYLWSGTVRESQSADSPAKLYNEEAVYDAEVSWMTFPERLEELGISWKCYQNEIWLPSGLHGEHDAWLTNFGDNPLEYFKQFHVRFAAQRRRHVQLLAEALPAEIKDLESRIAASELPSAGKQSLEKQLADKRAVLKQLDQERSYYTAENWDKLSAREKALHEKAFSTNFADPSYRQLATHTYDDNGQKRSVLMPKGDVFHSFRQDVRNGKLPTVSWLTAPERFSDHHGSPWYGAWYIAEAIDILTSNPKVWKKTIFILTYDENDGYFDHVPPFVAPHPRRPETGRVSAGIDTRSDYVDAEEESKLNRGRRARESSIGLGYRVPMIIASPWTRGGCVCSQVFDHTSVLQFLEKFLSHKIGRPVEEPNISQWRRTVCGDLRSAFQANGDVQDWLHAPPDASTVIERIHRAKFKQPPSDFKPLTTTDLEQIRREPRASPLMPRQEPGIRRSSPLPYELHASCLLNAERDRAVLSFEADNKQFGQRAAGAPFVVYARTSPNAVEVRDYAVAAGSHLEDSWSLADFTDGMYDLCVYGPNGFYREFRGTARGPRLATRIRSAHARAATLPNAGPSLSRNVEVEITNQDTDPCDIEISTQSYGYATHRQRIGQQQSITHVVDAEHSFGWYDINIRAVDNRTFEHRFAGRMETGEWSFSDPLIGREII
jgi:phospholipase C